eukprot:SAG31_NODE_7951_length_1556_cov_0.888813_3_plen_81_part_01
MKMTRAAFTTCGATVASSKEQRHPAGTELHQFDVNRLYVGITRLLRFIPTPRDGEEKAWTGSGGGFSDHFSPPSYQAEMVA